jgi:hypothetical protein
MQIRRSLRLSSPTEASKYQLSSVFNHCRSGLLRDPASDFRLLYSSVRHSPFSGGFKVRGSSQGQALISEAYLSAGNLSFRILPNPHFSRPLRNAHSVPTFVGVGRESFRPGKPHPRRLATGDLLTNRRICEKVRLNIIGYPICDRFRATCTASTVVVSRSEIVSIDF